MSDNYCIRIIGGRTQTPGCHFQSAGSPVNVSQNGNTVATLATGFLKEDICLQSVDPENDIFELSLTGSYGVRFQKLLRFIYGCNTSFYSAMY